MHNGASMTGGNLASKEISTASLSATHKRAIPPIKKDGINRPLSEENRMFHARGIKRIRTAVRGFADLCLTTRP